MCLLIKTQFSIEYNSHSQIQGQIDCNYNQLYVNIWQVPGLYSLIFPGPFYYAKPLLVCLNMVIHWPLIL